MRVPHSESLFMNKLTTILLFLSAALPLGAAVPLVTGGKPVAEIVLAADAVPSVKTAANELQKHLEAMSGAKLPIVAQASPDVANQVFVGESEATRKLGFTLDDVKYDGFKIVAGKNHVILAGREIDLFNKTFYKWKDLRGGRQAIWEKMIGHKWRLPPMIDPRDFSKEFDFFALDGTGTLYAAYDLLEQLGMRWYAPMADLGLVTPKLADISIKEQNLKKEPEFPVRMFTDVKLGDSADAFLWNKCLKGGVGTPTFVPTYHALSGPLAMYPTEQPQEYYGKVQGKTLHSIPRLSNEKLRADMVEYLELVDQHFPGMDYVSLGQPDGWSLLDSDDTAAGWDKFSERGHSGRFSDYAWDFNLDLRKRYMEKHPEKKFVVMAYAITSRVPASLEKVPDNMLVVFTETSAYWMMPERRQELEYRNEWIAKMSSKDQLLIWEYYLQHAPNYSFPPVPVIFPKLMKESFSGLYDHSLGFLVEVGWKSGADVTKARNEPQIARPWISHIMLYLHSKLCWDRNLDVQATLNEYYDLFYGPAKAEMKEFFEFAESIWTSPEARQITASGGFLKPEDVDRYFDILQRAKAKAGDTIYGKRIDGIRQEMDGLSLLFEKLKRKGPSLQIKASKAKPLIDGDLEKPFWLEEDPKRYGFYPLKDMLTGETPEHVETKVAFRWLNDNSALIVGIECIEPKMSKLREACEAADSPAIYGDDMVEIRLETASGIRPFIAINSAGVVLDECITERLEDLPNFYRVGKVAVKKYPDRWTAEVQIDAKPISGGRPTKFLPWGVNVSRQRMAGNEPEHYMLSPSGTKFGEPTCMGNIFVRK
jgi:hypothetical protein